MLEPSITEAPHPGKVLAERLAGLQMSASKLSRHLSIPVNRVTQIINGQRGISGDSALRLGRFFDTTPEFWLDLQKAYELRRADEDKGDQIRQTVPTLTDVAKGRQPTTESSYTCEGEAV